MICPICNNQKAEHLFFEGVCTTSISGLITGDALDDIDYDPTDGYSDLWDWCSSKLSEDPKQRVINGCDKCIS